MDQCPDVLTIQAVLDGEEKSEKVNRHIQNCLSCRQVYRDLSGLVSAADRLGSEAVLPDQFYKTLTARVAAKPFPAGLVAAVMFLFTFLSAYLLEPGYIQWWLSVGMTGQISYVLDIFFDVLFMLQTLGPFWLIITLTTLVVFEVLILNKLKVVEGLNDG